MKEKSKILLIGYIAVAAIFLGYCSILLAQTHANKIMELSKENATMEFNMKKIELHEFKARLEKADADHAYNIENAIGVNILALFFVSALPIAVLLPRNRKEKKSEKTDFVAKDA